MGVKFLTPFSHYFPLNNVDVNLAESSSGSISRRPRKQNSPSLQISRQWQELERKKKTHRLINPVLSS